MQVMHLSDWMGWSQDQSPPRPHSSVGSGGEGIVLKSHVYFRPSDGKQLFSFCFCITSYALEFIPASSCMKLCYPTVTAVFSITSYHYS